MIYGITYTGAILVLHPPFLFYMLNSFSLPARYLTVLALYSLASCSDENYLIPQPQVEAGTSTASNSSSTSISLGKKLNNPYTVVNMAKAYTLLTRGEKYTFQLGIRTTHRYVQFAPRNEEEYEQLANDSTLTIFDHPLDYELNGNEGGTYHDQSLPQNQPTYQYAVVPASFNATNQVPFNVLADLYLPEQDASLDQNSEVVLANISSLVDKAEALVESYATTPPIYYPVDPVYDRQSYVTKSSYIQTAARTANYQAQGRLQVFDTRRGALIPLPGVKVRVRRWFTYEDAITDENGNYLIARSFNRPVNYAVFYEREDFDIRSGTFVQSWYNGPKQSSPWNLDIMDGAQRLYAHVNRAASDYYYRNSFGIKSPPRNSFWKSAVKIAAYDDAGTLGSHCKDCRLFGALPRLIIHSSGTQGERFSDEIYGTTVHELAHASHWEFRKNNWSDDQTEERLKESWAEGVEWLLTVNRYWAYGDRPNRTDNYQGRLLTSSSTLVYSPIAVDLLDPRDQSINCTGPGCIKDPVQGFSFREMEQALYGANGFLQWRENLLGQPGHSSLRPQVEVLFSNYL